MEMEGWFLWGGDLGGWWWRFGKLGVGGGVWDGRKGVLGRMGKGVWW